MDIAIYGDRVRTARILRELKSIELSAALGWPPSRQTVIEQSAVVRLEKDVLTSLAKTLRFPEVFFTTSPGPSLGPEDMLFRAPVATTKREKIYLAEFARIVGEILNWLDSYHRLPPVKIPSAAPGTPVAEAALQARESLSLDAGKPINNLTHRLERARIAYCATESHLVCAA